MMSKILDWKYYLDCYSDLRMNGINTEEEAIKHWNNLGKYEERNVKLQLFDWKFYLDYYSDLRMNGIHTEEQAIKHWNNHGKLEKRMPFYINTTDKHSIGLLIPSTSNGRHWNNSEETYLYKTLKSFINSTLLDQTIKNGNIYKFYIGIDRNDKILDTEIFKTEINNIIKPFTNIQIEYIYMDGITKGHLTVMWNKLFIKALNDNCDYFFQCGDDIEFKTKGWIDDCIYTLQINDNIGLTGPINNHPHLLTQTFVSRKHYDLCGYYFPEEIINWYCDDWINEIYRSLNAYFPLQHHLCDNVGGETRYTINEDKMREKCTELVNRDLLILKKKKNAVVVLTRGYININDYDTLIKRNISIERNLNDKNTHILIFHEGNINIEHQTYIIGKTKNLNIIFICIKDYAFTDEKKHIKHYEPSAEFGLNYRHMCSFWFVDFWNFVKEYTNIIRIDEDCEIMFNIDKVFDKLHNKVSIFGMWSEDVDYVTHNLNKFTLEFICKHTTINNVKEHLPSGPYTNVIGLNLNLLRTNDVLHKYIKNISDSNNIYIYRWGDLPLWGEVLYYFYNENNYLLDEDIKYFHGSHNIDVNFDWQYYLDKYPDLRQNGVQSKEQAILHWNTCGKNEGRITYKQ